MEIPTVSRPPLALVVDDHDSVRRLFRRVLTGAGFEVTEVADGFDAIGAAKREHPDVVVLDGDLPVLDGFEVCRVLRAHAETAAIPIVFVTGMSAPAYRDQALEAGADVFLTKPVDVAELVAHVRAVVVRA